jgi:hypothetical protein
MLRALPAVTQTCLKIYILQKNFSEMSDLDNSVSFVSRLKGFQKSSSSLTPTEGVWEQGAEEDIWTEEGWGDGRMEKIA